MDERNEEEDIYSKCIQVNGKKIKRGIRKRIKERGMIKKKKKRNEEES